MLKPSDIPLSANTEPVADQHNVDVIAYEKRIKKRRPDIAFALQTATCERTTTVGAIADDGGAPRGEAGC